jgi:hypothetical protein
VFFLDAGATVESNSRASRKAVADTNRKDPTKHQKGSKMKRTKLTTLVLAIGIFGSVSCLGPNKLFNGLNDWNMEATGSDIGNELIFLGLNLIPVYAVAYMVDILVMNTIEYFGD